VGRPGQRRRLERSVRDTVRTPIAGRPLHHHRRERHLAPGRSPGLPAPREQLGLADPVPVRNITHRRRVGLGHKPRLILGAPPPTPTDTREYLDPPRHRHRHHIITRHHHLTKPTDRSDSAINPAVERWEGRYAYSATQLPNTLKLRALAQRLGNRSSAPRKVEGD
jgi:hypothetical protein